VDKNKKKIVIVGAGPGGLAAAMLLANKGFAVTVFEKNSQPGGRTSEIKLGDFRFDVGPTFLMMKFVLDEIFVECGKRSEDYLNFIRLAPMYRLILPDDRYIDSYEDREKMRIELARVFPGNELGLDKFYHYEKKRYEALMPILQGNNQNIADALKSKFLKALPYFAIGHSVFDEMGRYFPSALARLTFTFQSKYLGMSPWECPGAFGLVPYTEHAQGIYHVVGGLSEITRQMAKAAIELGAEIKYQSPVKELLHKGKKITGVLLENGENVLADEVVVNADFGYAANNLMPQEFLKKYSADKLKQTKISCSIFMWYVGLKKQYHLNHNTIVFAKDYKKNVEDIFRGNLTEDGDISFYVRDTSDTDPKLAPIGQSAMYILVPVPNCRANINWQKQKEKIRSFVIEGLKQRLGITDFEENIVVEKILTPDDWHDDYNIYEGAVFNLSHNLDQMLWFRPHNHFEELENCYLVGGGTHPGSGLPTIFESGRIVSNLIFKKYQKKD